MTKLHFAYDMQIQYSVEVSNCNFTIKCIPENTQRQKIENIRINLFPNTEYNWGKDGFKNTQIWGLNAIPHTDFRFQIEGDATTGLADYEEMIDEDLAMVFAHPHGLNRPGESIKTYFKEKIQKIDTCTEDKVLSIMDQFYNDYSYESFTTNVNTSAEEAFAQGCGVCQDYAHILISLLHLCKIPARYITGFIIGEGQSHAWVEYLHEDKWYGVDPTHNRKVDDTYIKIGHGRDAADCMINRGIMHGGGLHYQSVNVSVQEV